MCGIAGVANFHNNQSCLAPHLIRMVDQMRHRGPDDEGFLLGGDEVLCYKGNDTISALTGAFPHIESALDTKSTVAFGHRRLSIIDLSELGHQPMQDESGNYSMVFNGEIYNYQEISRELVQLGCKFKSETDTEVVLQAYIQWGESCLTKFNGMFAFAIYNKSSHELFLARDRIGIKPLYYTIQNDQFIFGSEIKTIIASGLYTAEVSLEGLWHNLSFAITPRPNTLFKDVKALDQAHWMKVNLQSGDIKKERFWSIPVNTQDQSMTEQDAIDMLEEELTKAVKYRLIADVEVGTFMSGGIDSTTVSSIASRLHPGIKAFTLGFEGEEASEYDEVREAKATAEMCNMEHIVQKVNPAVVLEHIDDIVSRYEEPAATLAPNYLISKLVADNNIKVVLSGLGGDELFAGYTFYTKKHIWEKARRVNWALDLIPEGTNSKIDRVKKFSGYNDIHSYYIGIYSTFNEREKHQLIDKFEFDTHTAFIELYNKDKASYTDDIELMNYYDLISYIGNHHVYRLDQFTMHFSLEGRVPFLDHNVVETAFKIPSRYKIKNGERKYVLRKVASKYIHASSLNMKKKGFRFPIEYWLNNQIKDLSIDTLASLKKRDIFNSAELDRVFKDDGNRDAKQVILLMMTELWFQKFIDAE